MLNFKFTSFACLLICGIILGLSTLGLISWYWIWIPIIVYLHLLVFGAIYIQWNFYTVSKNKLTDLLTENELPPNALLLTFDDGIHPIHTLHILDQLKEQQVQACFFLIGKNIPGHEAIVKRIFDEGHVIGNHSDQHAFWFDMQSSANMLAEIKFCNERIRSITGQNPIYFRPPYGVTNPNLAKAIRQSNLQSIGWNLRSMDTVAKSSQQLLDTLRQKTKPHQIVLLHDRCEITAQVLTDYIIFCKQQGFNFARIEANPNAVLV